MTFSLCLQSAAPGLADISSLKSHDLFNSIHGILFRVLDDDGLSAIRHQDKKMTTTSDQQLALRLQDGDLEALGELYDRYRQLVFRTALAITGDYDAANDLLQDVFLRLFRFANRIDLERPLQPWLYRMTTNLSYTWVKRDQRWKRPFDILADWLAGPSRNLPYETVERMDDWDRLQRAVAALPISQRVVVVLYYLNELSLQEIGDILDIPLGTVKSRLHYGRQALKKELSLGMGSFTDKESLPDLGFEGL
jgi:RNA polymerase sigma-70 factor (ECF subfamily)